MLDITPQQRENLLQLADYLYALPEGYKSFDMNEYAQVIDWSLDDELTIPFTNFNPEMLHSCDTVACAIGHGPSAGIKAKGSVSDWLDYSMEVFGAGFNDDLYKWCFHGYWADEDNTAKGAAQRIYYALDFGLDELKP